VRRAGPIFDLIQLLRIRFSSSPIVNPFGKTRGDGRATSDGRRRVLSNPGSERDFTEIDRAAIVQI